MYYAVNNDVGVIKDIESFNSKIAEVLRYEGKVNIIPLAETREELFEEIYNRTFEIDSLASAIRHMAALHQEGTTVDYDYTDYLNLCEVIHRLLGDIEALATATEPGREENYLQPLMEKETTQVKPKDITNIKLLKKGA